MNYEAVVIGASAGGLEALGEIFSNMSSEFSLPVIVVQHRHADSDNYLIQSLSVKSVLPVKEADEKEVIKPGMIYIAPANYHLLVEKDRTFSLSVAPPEYYARPSINVLFDSAADVYRSGLIGVILTGANQDGAEGLNEIKKQGGTTIVQNPAAARADAMPRAAIKRTEVDYVVSLQEIGPKIIDLSRCQLWKK